MNPYVIAGLALVVVWAVYKIARLARFKGERKERDRAQKDEREKVEKLADLSYDGHDINRHFRVLDNKKANASADTKP